MEIRSNFIGLSTFIFCFEQTVGHICDGSKLSKFTLGFSEEVIYFVASAIRRKHFLVRRGWETGREDYGTVERG